MIAQFIHWTVNIISLRVGNMNPIFCSLVTKYVDMTEVISCWSPTKVKSIISILDDSSDEEGEVKSKPINTKEHKIMKALECDSLGFLD